MTSSPNTSGENTNTSQTWAQYPAKFALLASEADKHDALAGSKEYWAAWKKGTQQDLTIWRNAVGRSSTLWTLSQDYFTRLDQQTEFQSVPEDLAEVTENTNGDFAATEITETGFHFVKARAREMAPRPITGAQIWETPMETCQWTDAVS